MIAQTTVVLALLAASSNTTLAFQQPQREVRHEAIRAGLDFRSAHQWIDGRKVVNGTGEDVAMASDAVVDRGTGKVEYVVVKTGTILGLGGKSIAIPYSSFGWDSAGDRFVLATTPEQLKGLPEFSAKEWSAMMEAKDEKDHPLNDYFSFNPADPYAGSLDESKAARVEGEITRVERVTTSNFGDHTIIHVTGKDGSVRKVALGPSWFISGGVASPARGDQVTIETLSLTRNPDQLVVAREMRINGQDVRLRDKSGSPTWALKSVESGKNRYSTRYWRYVLSSTVRGMRVDCRGEECGKINDLIVERGSGQIAFLSIDPNQNFLGISDTKRLVPWSICSVSLDGVVRVDASKDMIVASPETPANLPDLSRSANTVYSAYQVDAPKFEPTKPTPVSGANTQDSWGKDGPVITAIEPGSKRTVKGKITDVSETKFEGGVQPATTITVRDGSKDTVVLLGPVWYMDRQNLKLNKGEEVVVEVCRTRINGTPYELVRTLDRGGTRVVLVEDGKPAWEGRK
jgi:sporulation protein YlmC with PRC-barrel domain